MMNGKPWFVEQAKVVQSKILKVLTIPQRSDQQTRKADAG